jgi:toxin ParE1/3/4
MVQCIRASVERLATSPGLGRPGRVTGTRELVIVGTPYIVPYRVKADVIQIITVLHGARRWPGPVSLIRRSAYAAASWRGR